MLRVTIELVPHGDESRAKRIGEMIIANDGTGGTFHGNYQALVGSDQWSGEPEQYVRIHSYDRRKNVWDLVEMVLRMKHLKFNKDDIFYELLKKRLRKEG